MWDLVLMELLIGGLLFISLLRPFVKGFRGVDGLALVPALALALVAALFPAYGFRPEVLPLALFAAFRFFLGLPHLAAVLRRMRADDYGERPFLPTAFGLVLLVFSCGFAVVYAPAEYGADPVPFTAATAHDRARGVDLYVRSYTATVAGPTIVLIPPVSGSVGAVDSVCGALAQRGFGVLTYSRRGLDVPAYRTDGGKAYPSPGQFIRHAAAFLGGTRWRDPNLMGRVAEDERLADIRFLVEYAGAHMGGGSIFIAAYGSAGAAAVRYGAEAPESVRGIVALEGPILSSLVSEPERQATENSSLGRWWFRLTEILKPYRIAGVGDVPQPKVPTLFILSDRIQENEHRDGRYASVLRVLRTMKVPGLLVALSGAGPFDYSDTGIEIPLYSALVPGLGTRPGEGALFARDAAALIGNFAAVVAEDVPSRLVEVASEAYSETAGPWKSGAATDILGR